MECLVCKKTYRLPFSRLDRISAAACALETCDNTSFRVVAQSGIERETINDFFGKLVEESFLLSVFQQQRLPALEDILYVINEKTGRTSLIKNSIDFTLSILRLLRRPCHYLDVLEVVLKRALVPAMPFAAPLRIYDTKEPNYAPAKLSVSVGDE